MTISKESFNELPAVVKTVDEEAGAKECCPKDTKWFE